MTDRVEDSTGELKVNAATSRDEIRCEPRPDCLICGSPGDPLYQGIEDRLFDAPGTWDLSRCSNPRCRLLWLNPMPTTADIDRAYRHYYTHNQRSGSAVERVITWLLYGGLGLLGERRRSDIMYLGDLAPGRVLEIGFGDGRRLERLAARGWTAEGQEVDPVAAHQARTRGLTVHEGHLADCRLPVGSYDAIVGNHVIEHVHDPIAVIRECARLLVPNGRIVLVTPNTGSYGHLRFRGDWLALEPPRHLHLFAAPNMYALLAKAGFVKINIWTSMAHAGSVFRGSIDISRSGRHVMSSMPRVRAAVLEVGHLIRARLTQSKQASAGEELVVCAFRKR